MKVAVWPGRRKASDNPYLSSFVDALERGGVECKEFWGFAMVCRHDALVVHWPEMPLNRRRTSERLLGCAFVIIATALQRFRGTRIVWVTHNAGPHENRASGLTRRYLDLFVSLVDGVVHPSESSRRGMCDAMPALRERPHMYFLHGPYSRPKPAAAHAPGQRQLPQRADEFVLGALGQIRPYKGTVELVTEFLKSDRNAGLRLVIAGRCSSDELCETIRLLAGSDPRVTFSPRHHSDEELYELLQLLDVLVLPYLEGENSGAAMLGLSHGVPIVASDLPIFRELQERVGIEWVRIPAGELRTWRFGDIRDMREMRGKMPDLSWCDWDLGASRFVAWLKVLPRRPLR